MTETSSDRASAKAIDESLIEEIVRRILRITSPDRIIMFGSAVTGEMTKDSDIDLLVLESSPGDIRKKIVRLGDVLRGLGFPMDVIVMSVDRFEESKEVIGGIANPAHKQGKVIYEAA